MAGKRPWTLVLGAVLGLFVSVGPVMQFTFGIFVKPISEELGGGRALVSSAMAACILCTGLAVPAVGWLIDRFGVRSVLLPSIVFFSGLVSSLSIVPLSGGAFILLHAAIGLVGAALTPLPYATAIASAFDKRRGLALGIAMAGVGLGAALIPRYASELVRIWGWRGAYAGLSLVTLLISFPAAAFLMPGKSADTAALTKYGLGLTASAALGTRCFWIMTLVIFLVAAATNGTIAHLFPLLTDRGISAHSATLALGAAGLSLITGRLVTGYLLDRVDALRLATIAFLMPLAGISLLWGMPGLKPALLGSALVGIGLGGEVDLVAFLTVRYFGRQAFGQIYGYLFVFFMCGSSAGPFLMGLGYDKFGSYRYPLIALSGFLVVASVLVVRLPPCKPEQDAFSSDRS